MCLILEIVMAVVGLVLLIVGKVNLSGAPRSGALVRVAGFIFLLPFPLSFAAVLLIGFAIAAKGGGQNLEDIRGIAVGVEVAIILGCLISGLIVASMAPKSEPKRRRMVDDDFDDSPRRTDAWDAGRRDFDDGGRGSDDDRFRA